MGVAGGVSQMGGSEIGDGRCKGCVADGWFGDGASWCIAYGRLQMIRSSSVEEKRVGKGI